MFKEIFVLKKSSWHAKMMKYIWGWEPEKYFSHICPYFWLSVLNCFIFIEWWAIKESFKILGRFLMFIWTAIMGTWEKNMAIYDARMAIKRENARIKREEREQKRREIEHKKWQAYWEKLKTEPHTIAKTEIIQKKESRSNFLQWVNDYHWESYYEIRDKVWEIKHEIEQKVENTQWIKEVEKARLQAEAQLKKMKDKFLSVYKGEDREALLNGDGWENYLAIYNAKKKQAQIEKEAAQRRAIKDQISKITRIVKPIITVIAYTLAILAALFLSYWIWKGSLSLIHYISSVKHSTWRGIGRIFKWIGIILMIAGIITGIVFAFIRFKIGEWFANINWPTRPEWTNVLIVEKKPRKQGEYTRRGNKYKWQDNFEIFCETFGDFFYFLWKQIKRPFKAIGIGLSFIKQMFKAVDCPPTKWID